MSNSPLVATTIAWRAIQPPVWTTPREIACTIAACLAIACIAALLIRRIRSLRSQLADYASRADRAERENAQLQSTLLAAANDWGSHIDSSAEIDLKVVFDWLLELADFTAVGFRRNCTWTPRSLAVAAREGAAEARGAD